MPRRASTRLLTTAWLSPAAPMVDEPTREALRQQFRDGTLLHLFMDRHGWPKTPGSAARCLAFVDTLTERLGEELPDTNALRRRRRDQSGAADG